MKRCTSYFRGRGIFRYSGKRCELDAGHTGPHECSASFLEPGLRHRWGRTNKEGNRAAD